MKKIIIMFVLSLSLFAIEQKQEGVGWLDIFSYDESSTKERVLLIGDSIVRQYINSVRNGIKDKYTVTRLSTSKSICSSQYINQLSIAMTQRYKIILINNGLHDFSATNEEYEECYKKSLDYIVKENLTSTIVLVNTTGVNGIKTRNDIVIQRNRSLLKLANLYKFNYLNLYSIVEGQKELWSDNYHYKEGGGKYVS